MPGAQFSPAQLQEKLWHALGISYLSHTVRIEPPHAEASDTLTPLHLSQVDLLAIALNLSIHQRAPL